MQIGNDSADDFTSPYENEEALFFGTGIIK